MQKIVRFYVLTTAAILCMTLLVSGIIGVNSETSYVISGKKEDVLRVQSTTSERLLIKSGDEEESLAKLSSKDSENVKQLLAAILPAPFAQIVWAM